MPGVRDRRFNLKEVHIIGGPMRGNSFPLNEGVTTIGRAAGNDIRLLEKDISRHHAQLIKKDDKVFVLDLASLQGVLVDGEQIDPGVEVEIGKESRIRIGKTILAFQMQAPVKKQPAEPLEDSSRNYIRSLELLLNVSNILAQSLDTNELFDKVVDQIFNLLKRIDRGAILLLDKDTGKLREVVSKIRPGHEKDLSSAIHYSRTIVRRTIDRGKPILMSDTSYANKDELSESIEKMNVRSIMCVPLTYKSETRGVVYVDTIGLPEGFRKDDLKVLTALSNTAAIAIENAHLYEELRQELTERRRAERELREARKELEKEIKKRTDELSKTVEFLKQEISDHMQAEEALRESEEKYRSLFHESRDALYITTRDGAFVEVNQSYLDLFGYTKKEIANLKVQDTYTDLDDRPRFQGEIEKKGSVRDFNIRLRKKDGTEIDCLITATVRKTEEGRILGYHGIIREIT
jgi:PAS domain S-box-containing protein